MSNDDHKPFAARAVEVFTGLGRRLRGQSTTGGSSVADTQAAAAAIIQQNGLRLEGDDAGSNVTKDALGYVMVQRSGAGNVSGSDNAIVPGPAETTTREQLPVVAGIRESDAPVGGRAVVNSGAGIANTAIPEVPAATAPSVVQDFQAAKKPLAGKPLTPRERSVLELVGQGFKNKAIVERLKISDVLVKKSKSSGLEKIEVPSRSDPAMVAAALSKLPGAAPPPPPPPKPDAPASKSDQPKAAAPAKEAGGIRQQRNPRIHKRYKGMKGVVPPTTPSTPQAHKEDPLNPIILRQVAGYIRAGYGHAEIAGEARDAFGVDATEARRYVDSIAAREGMAHKTLSHLREALRDKERLRLTPIPASQQPAGPQIQ